jgi:hypothetical protein
MFTITYSGGMVPATHAVRRNNDSSRRKTVSFVPRMLIPYLP